MGLLGSSVALSAKRELARSRVVGYSHRDSTRKKARQYEVAHEIADSLEQAITAADMVILATPIQTFKDYFKQIAPYLKDGCIVTDVGSTKALSHQWAAAPVRRCTASANNVTFRKLMGLSSLYTSPGVARAASRTAVLRRLPAAARLRVLRQSPGFAPPAVCR